MAFMNIFENDAFSLASMSDAIERVPTNPGTLNQLNIFSSRGIRDLTIGIEERKGTFSLIPFSDRGAPMGQGSGTKSKLRYFKTARIAKADTITAGELQFVREFGTEDQVKQLQTELARRMSGPTGLIADVEYTKEYMALAAIQGLFAGVDDTGAQSIIYDYFSEFELGARPADLAFNFAARAAGSGDLREFIQQNIIRSVRDAAQGARYSGFLALCGRDFFDALLKCPEIVDTYKTDGERKWLRTSYDGMEFDYFGVTFKEYVGDHDSNNDVKIADDKCVIIPTGLGNSVFEVVYAPAESFADIGTVGRELYAYTTPDTKHDRFVELEVASYPLYICKRPDLLRYGKLGA